MSKCRYCGKPVPTGRKYCSSKGRGNHKDKYWNSMRFYSGDISEARKNFIGLTDRNGVGVDCDMDWDDHPAYVMSAIKEPFVQGEKVK